MTPFDLELNYEYWTYRMPSRALLQSEDPANAILDDIMTSILPKEEYEELPTGFSIVGHVGKSLCTTARLIKLLFIS